MPGGTTSIHRLNGDRRLSLAGKVGYFLLNWLNNQLPYSHVDPRLPVRDFRCELAAIRCASIPRDASPTRTLSDLFWSALPWRDIENELGAIQILDVGCGAGQYGPRMMAWSGNRIMAYVGVDVHEHREWTDLERAGRRFRFIQTDASDPAQSIPVGTNFVMSQSAIEHIEHDLRFFAHVRDYVQSRTAPALQIHLCPSAACLKLYLLHGVRQYTPRTLSIITRLFNDSDVVLYRLGGRACNRLHYQFITFPLMIQGVGDLRVTRAAEYERRLFEAIKEDMSRPQRSPAFYALVIHTHPRARLFI
jgi:SAM-dependent methyltransferase